MNLRTGADMAGETYTHRDLARLLGVSETTIKSYRSKFSAFLPVAREGKPVRLHPEALEVCRKIRDLFADGLSILQTMQALRAEFKEYPQNRRLSTAQSAAQVAARPAAPREAAADPGLALQLQALAEAQLAAHSRIEQLEAEVRNLATLEAASKSLVAELLAELRSARAGQAAPAPASEPARVPTPEPTPEPAPEPSPEPAPPSEPKPARAEGPEGPEGPLETVVTARKIVTVHGARGAVASYALGREPRPAQPFADIPRPGPEFLDLPAVIHSDRGDFLGLPGGQSVRRLVETLSPEGASQAAWFQESDEAWNCAIPLGRAQKREILFERTYTPRGNLVGLIRRMRINEAEATPAQLQDIFRQLRDQMS